MNGECELPVCGVKDGLPCEMGTPEITDCPHFKPAKEVSQPVAGAPTEDQSGQRLPWTGRALGLSDMSLASARSPAKLIGLVGPFNAGKTGFLAALFAHFAKIGIVGPFSFAGSYTLQAWARLRQFTAWPTSFGPTFPPHTPDSAERVPSLLHLAFRNGENPLRDVLFTDAPGEWFSRWIKNQSADNAKGARWIAQHATHFLFFIDRNALAGPTVGKVRNDTLQLARLIGEELRGRPIIVIWAKSDLQTDPAIETPIREKLQKFFGDHPTFDVHVEDPRCLEVLAQLLTEPAAEPLGVRKVVAKSNSAFLAYGGASS